MERHGEPSRFAAVAGGAVFLVGGFAAWLVFATPGAHVDRLVSDCAYVLAPLVATGTALHRARRDRSRGWALLAAWTFLWACGSMVWLAYELRVSSVPPYPSLSEVGYLGSGLPAFVGLLLLPRSTRHESSRSWGTLDAAVIATSVVLVSWVTVLGPAVLVPAADALTQLCQAIYPLNDVVLGSLVLALATRAPTSHRWEWAFLGAGISVLAVTDHVYVLNATTFVPGTLLDLGWVLAFGLVALAPLAPSARTTPASERWMPVLTKSLPYLPVSLVVVVLVSQDALLDDPVAVTLGLAALVVFLGRELAVLVDNERLNRQLVDLLSVHTADVALLRSVAASTTADDTVHESVRATLRAVCAHTGLHTGHAHLLGDAPDVRLDGEHVWHPAAPPVDAATESLTEAVRAADEPVWSTTVNGLGRSETLVGLPVHVGSELTAVLTFQGAVQAFSGASVLRLTNEVCAQLGRSMQRHRAEAMLRHQATHDPLTGLPNRKLFHDRVEQALARLQRRPGLVAVLLLDLDGFKDVNDSLGHAAGDALLVEVGRRIRFGVRPADTVARLGGDEFALVLEDVSDAVTARRIAEKVVAIASRPVTVDGRLVTVGASVGVASARRDDGGDVGRLLHDADQAMYRAKAAGRGQVVVFEPGGHQQAVTRLELESDLRRAMSDGGLQLHYQPVVDLRSGHIRGAEALLRWQHPTLGLVPPARLVPIAEESGLIRPLGSWVVDQAVRQAHAWRRQGHAGFEVAVNVSVEQLHAGFPDEISAALSRHGLEPASLLLEVTESALGQDQGAVRAALDAVRGLGVRLAVDDFGTGYSALSRLRHFSLDVLKIDRSFVAGLGDSAGDVLVDATISMAHGLGLLVVAEGIETEKQRQFLVDHGCDRGQGFLMSAAVPADQFARLLAAAATLPPGRHGGHPEVTAGSPPPPAGPRMDVGLLAVIGQGVRGELPLAVVLRSVLTELCAVTGLGSAYLTRIDGADRTQQMVITRDGGGLDLQEGAVTSLGDSLCQHALDEPVVTVDARARFPESRNASRLGIRSYVGVPVRRADGSVYGTLCVADATPGRRPAPGTVQTMELVARIIGDLVSVGSVEAAEVGTPNDN